MVSLTALATMLCGIAIVAMSVTKDNPAKTLLGSVYAGLGIAMLVFPQPFVYFVFSTVFLAAIIGCVIQVAVQPNLFGAVTIASLATKLVAVIIPLAYAFGFIA